MNHRGFTLIELLIIVGIIAILATVVLLALNPSEIINQAKDSTRAAELKSVDKATSLAIVLNPNIYIGSSSVVYTSLYDSSRTCNSYLSVLPTLPPSWSYACAPTSTAKSVNGSGWLPINFQSLTMSPLETLPVDSLNDAASGIYYSYIADPARMVWKFSGDMKSISFSNSGGKDVESKDGGPNLSLFEVGTDLSLSPSADIKVPTVCAQPGFGVYGPNTEYYSKWKIPGSGKVTVTKLWYWQKNYSGTDDLLGTGEQIEVAIYVGTDTDYAKAGTAIVNGNGSNGSGAEGWLSGDLDHPVEITLGQNYVFGIGRIGNPTYTVPRDLGQACTTYLPRTPSHSGLVSGGLDSNVTVFSNHTAFPDIGDPGYPKNTGNHVGIFGISYILR